MDLTDRIESRTDELPGENRLVGYYNLTIYLLASQSSAILILLTSWFSQYSFQTDSGLCIGY